MICMQDESLCGGKEVRKKTVYTRRGGTPQAQSVYGVQLRECCNECNHSMYVFVPPGSSIILLTVYRYRTSSGWCLALRSPCKGAPAPCAS